MTGLGSEFGAKGIKKKKPSLKGVGAQPAGGGSPKKKKEHFPRWGERRNIRIALQEQEPKTGAREKGARGRWDDAILRETLK